MDFNEIEKAYAMGRAYAQGLKYAKLMAKLNTVAQDTMKDGFATLVDSEGQPYVANLNPKEKERYSETKKPLSQVKKEEKAKKEQEQKEAEAKMTPEELAKAKAEYYGVEKCYSSVAELLADPEIDAVGACIGPKGARVNTIVEELSGEKVTDLHKHFIDKIVIKKDGEVFCTLTFNAEGQLLNIAFAPGRQGNHPAQYAEAVANGGYRFTVTGLTESTDYTYNITVKDAANKTIKSHSGKFTTESLTAVEYTHIQSPISNCQKILRDGQLLILRDGVEYNAMGQEL